MAARDTGEGMVALRKFSEVAKDGCCPKCGYAVMKRGVNAVTGNLAVGVAAMVATGGILGPARKTIKCGGCGSKYLQG
jgi:rubredoxin